MNTTDFLAQLSVKLRERGIEEETILRHTAKLERYAPELISEIEDLDSIADEISILLKKRAESCSSAAGPAEPAKAQESPEDINDPIASRPEETADEPFDGSGIEASDSDSANPLPPETPDPTSAAAEAAGTSDLAPENPTSEEDAAGTPSPLDSQAPAPMPDAIEDLPEYDEDLSAPGLFASIKAFFSSPHKKELTEAERRGNRFFWIFFFLALPVTLPLSIGILLLFGGLYLSLFTLIVALLGGLILVAAGGTALALIGVIYGLTQIFKYVPIGLYEIGFGIALGGGAMFSGIVIYNIALRLIPYTIKKLSVFFVFLCKQVKKLFILAKGACVKL